MFQRFKISNADKKRHVDDNGYITVDESPILRAGILEYYGSELIDGAFGDEIDGVKIIPGKVYRVYIPPEELERAADSFKLLPITNDHEWLGNGGADARDFQEGSTGESVMVKDDMIFVPLKFTGDEIIAALNRGKQELSASYTNTLSKSDNADYDFVATDIKGNHVALVEKGRCGPDVKVLNKQMERKHMKIKNEMKLVLDGREIDLDEFLKRGHGEDAHAGPDAIADSNNDDPREIIREIISVAGKPNDEFDGGEDEKVHQIVKLVAQISDMPTVAGNSSNDDDTDDDSDPGVDGAHNDPMVRRATNAMMKQIAKKDAGLKRAYNAAAEIVGEFNPFGMTEREILVRALNHAGVTVGGESNAELYAMLRVCNSATRIDNSFDYNFASNDVIEVNI